MPRAMALGLTPSPEPLGLRLAISLTPSNGKGKLQAPFHEGSEESADFRVPPPRDFRLSLKIQALAKLNFLETSNAQSARVSWPLG